MELKAAAIVARCVNYKESDKMLTLITREHGRLDAIARGSRNTNSKLLACTQQFCASSYCIKRASATRCARAISSIRFTRCAASTSG